ncbi:MAG TPA: M1 family metallopeptidase [Anaerolineae bacterium]|nr:M1 family metallopeptidase [Anaerolineae bacterium]
MRIARWLWILFLVVLAGILAACFPLSSDRAAQVGVSGDQPLPTPTVIGVPTAEKVNPFPEYRLSLALEPSTRRLVGMQEVTIPNHTGVDLDEIVFRLYPNLPQYGGRLDIGSVTVDGKPTTSSLRAGDTSLVIPLEHPLAPETSLDIELTFAVDLPLVEAGYTLFGYSQGIWSAPDAYPLLAVHDGSSWNEAVAPSHGDAVFADAAMYDVILTLPSTLTVAATGSVVSEAPDADGQRVYRIVGGPLREFAWLASANYQVAETTAYGTVLRSYYLPGDEAAGQATLNVSAAALRNYEDAFGPYPFDEMIVAEAPLLHFGMEYPGLNLIGLDLYRDQRAGLEDRVVHEIAHQWWYAQVGNDQVNTPWLDEGLAEYSMAIYYQQVFGEARANTLVNQRWLVPYQVAVENEYDAVVNQPSSAFNSFWELEVTVYAKAALFFHAVHQELGDEMFREVLQEYVNQFRWKIVTPDDFLQIAEAVSGVDLDALYNRWILSKQP